MSLESLRANQCFLFFYIRDATGTALKETYTTYYTTAHVLFYSTHLNAASTCIPLLERRRLMLQGIMLMHLPASFHAPARF